MCGSVPDACWPPCASRGEVCVHFCPFLIGFCFLWVQFLQALLLLYFFSPPRGSLGSVRWCVPGGPAPSCLLECSPSPRCSEGTVFTPVPTCAPMAVGSGTRSHSLRLPLSNHRRAGPVNAAPLQVSHCLVVTPCTLLKRTRVRIGEGGRLHDVITALGSFLNLHGWPSSPPSPQEVCPKTPAGVGNVESTRSHARVFPIHTYL